MERGHDDAAVMTAQLVRKTTFIWLLALVTAAWGGVVAGHDHFGIDHEHCHLCLLPQVADVAPEAPAADIVPTPLSSASPPAWPYSAPTSTVYRSRAPPA